MERDRKIDVKEFQMHLTALFDSLCLTYVTVPVQYSSMIEI